MAGEGPGSWSCLSYGGGVSGSVLASKRVCHLGLPVVKVGMYCPDPAAQCETPLPSLLPRR